MTNTTCTPVPDPTVRTTEQLIREITGLHEVIDARLTGFNEGYALMQKALDQQPLAITEAIRHLADVQNEKFASVRLQFEERDTRTEQTSRDSTKAIDAALQAAKEAVLEQNKSSAAAIAKAEAATSRQIEQIMKTIETGMASLNDKIEDAKTRTVALEQRFTAHDSSGKGTQTGQTNLWGWIVGVIGVVLGLIGGIGGLIALVSKLT